MYLLPFESNPRVFLICRTISLIGKTDIPEGSEARCQGSTYTSWKLKVVYNQPHVLLPQWADVHSKVNDLVESFVVTP